MDEEWDELPVIGDDTDQEERDKLQQDSREVEDAAEGQQEEHWLVEAVRVAAVDERDDFGQGSPGFSHLRSQLQEIDEAVDKSVIDVADGSSSEDEDESVDEGVVTITSHDPLAAARAAAILKLVNHLSCIDDWRLLTRGISTTTIISPRSYLNTVVCHTTHRKQPLALPGGKVPLNPALANIRRQLLRRSVAQLWGVSLEIRSLYLVVR